MQGVWSRLFFPLFSAQYSSHAPCKDLRCSVSWERGQGSYVSQLEEDIQVGVALGSGSG